MIPHPGCLAVCEMPRGGTQRGQICPHTTCRKEGELSPERRTRPEHPARARRGGISPPPALREAFMSFSRAEALRLVML